MDKNIRNILNTGKQPDLKTGEPIEWEMFYFYHLPIPAAFTEITKWQNNVRTVEGEITKYFLEQSAGSNFKFDMVQAQIIPKSNVVFAGNQFEAEIFIGAYNSSENPVINVGGSRINEFIDGKGIYKTTAQGEGEKTVSGEILVTSPLTGETKSYPFETKYQVSKPMMTVSAEKMNVVYRGLENPMAVSVPGVAPNQITATCSGCESFTGGNGKYICKPGKDKAININVSVKAGDKTQNMGAAEFRVKRIPDPTIKYIGKKNQETLSIAEASATGGALIPVLEDFDFPLYAKIEGFEVSFTVGGKLIEQAVSGNQIPSNFSDQMRKMDKKKLFFDKVRVRMPDNTVRTTSISFSIR
jgi:gliding motility-associated protein GldM